ncbi:MAG: hypothetical protein M3137_07285 [Actinomycetota bacterium]|nr:hypothetical protein [Actinomycetota bacterium]
MEELRPWRLWAKRLQLILGIVFTPAAIAGALVERHWWLLPLVIPFAGSIYLPDRVR